VAQIITFGKMLPRNATRDAARVLGHDYGAGDRLAKLIPEPVMGRSLTFDQYLEQEPDLRRAYDTEPEARQIIDTARGLEGIVRNAGIHAAAVVIADRPLTDIVPVQLMEDRGVPGPNGERAYKVVTQYSMKPIEEIGLLKMDFLGLRNLDVIEDCLSIIEESTGERPDMATLPLDDPKTYEMMSRGDSVGVFQFESEGMREALRKVKPTEFEDLVALNALYRPGAMRHIDTYARNKRNPDAISYIDERLRPITEATYSVILYQEQSMQIAKSVAGFSGAEADDLRKAIGKKNREAMAALKERFFEGARASGTSESVINELWAVNEAAADYSFNRSHAACYGLVGYRTAWLKANYPAEYMAALISSVMSTKDKVPFFVAQCEDMGIEVLPPDVNLSGHDFKVVDGNIRFGLDAVKGLGHQAVEAIVREREKDGPFTSIWDFCRRVDCQSVNKRCVESLVKCGALDSLPGTRTGQFEVLQQAQAAGVQAQQDAQLGQGSFFDLGDSSPDALAHHDPPVPGLPDERKQLNEWEKETLGLFLSSHPLKEVRHALRARVECGVADLASKKDGEWVTVGGMIAECKRIRTKKGDPMMFATLDDLEGQVELLVFNSAYAANADKVDLDKIVIVRGRVDHKEAGETKLVAQEVTPFEPTEEEILEAAEHAVIEAVVQRLTLEVSGGVPTGFLEDLKEVVGHHPGEHELLLAVGQRRLLLGPEFRVSASSACRSELSGLQGAARVLA
jgi:DNA polymerase-3 subunit alpha